MQFYVLTPFLIKGEMILLSSRRYRRDWDGGKKDTYITLDLFMITDSHIK